MPQRFMVAMRVQKTVETFHEAGSAGTLAGELPAKPFAGKVPALPE
jgi:hypothetical protein